MISSLSVVKRFLETPGTPLRARITADRITWPGVPPGAPLSATAGYTGLSYNRSGGGPRRRRTPVDAERLTMRVWGTTHAEAETTYRALVDTLASQLNQRVDLDGGTYAILYLAREVSMGIHLDDPDTGNPLVQSVWEIAYWRHAIAAS